MIQTTIAVNLATHIRVVEPSDTATQRSLQSPLSAALLDCPHPAA